MEYFITGYNQRKLDNQVTDKDFEIIGDKYKNDITVHYFEGCSILATNRTGIFTIELDDLWNTADLATSINYNNKNINCCPECYSKKYLARDMDNYKKQHEENLNSMAKDLAKKRYG